MKLVSVDDIYPAAYNPRQSDEGRLRILELSLTKLGFLLPLYVSKNKEILSGHQRHLIAQRLGFEEIPIDIVDQHRDFDESEIKGLNIAFNRATNDFSRHDTSKVAHTLSYEELYELAESLSSSNSYRCLETTNINPTDLLKNNPEAMLNDYAKNMAGTLRAKKIIMPAIITNSGKIINGVGRLTHSAQLGENSYPVVIINDDEAKFAESVLNKLTMDFDIQGKYEDLLRYNSFRRSRRTRKELGRGFVFTCIGSKPSYSFPLTNPENLKKWISIHGKTVVDFGAGHLTETNILRSVGIDVTPFEPYHITQGETINKEASLRIVDEFLSVIASGKKFDSIFISSVLNSVPFKKDREAIVLICHGLCVSHTRLFAVASGIDSYAYDIMKNKKKPKCKTHSTNRGFELDYEPGIILGDIGRLPKVQKYHSASEFRELFEPCFKQVAVSLQVHNMQAVCINPKPVNKDKLVEAIKFEFDLPYPDGSTMDRVKQALQAFEMRGVL